MVRGLRHMAHRLTEVAYSYDEEILLVSTSS